MPLKLANGTMDHLRYWGIILTQHPGDAAMFPIVARAESYDEPGRFSQVKLFFWGRCNMRSLT